MRVPQAVVVRPARSSEVQLVASILAEAAEWLRQRGDPLWVASELEPEIIQADVESGLYLAAFVSEEAVGTARFCRDDPLFWSDAAPVEALYLHRLAVRRSHAGGSVSKAIIEWVCRSAETSGCAYVRLDCDASRQRLRALYEAVGFVFHSERVVGAYTVARFQLAVPPTLNERSRE